MTSSPRETIVVQALNPLDVKREQLESLADVLISADRSFDVRVATPDLPRGPLAVPKWETIFVWIAAVDSALAIADRIRVWLRQRAKEAPERPKSVTLYGPTGEPITRLTVNPPDLEVCEESEIMPRKPPFEIRVRE
jgi:hypothetical protein